VLVAPRIPPENRDNSSTVSGASQSRERVWSALLGSLRLQSLPRTCMLADLKRIARLALTPDGKLLVAHAADGAAILKMRGAKNR
jgi:hypothetical protein